MLCYIGNSDTDGSESDDAKLLILNLISCKILFFFFSKLCNILIAGLSVFAAQAADASVITVSSAFTATDWAVLVN